MKTQYLLPGDLLTIALVTLIGFATHGQLNPPPWERIAASFVPLCIGWALAAPWLGLYTPGIASHPGQAAWRAAYAIVLGAPLAALLRAIWLNSVVLPVFAVVLAANAAFAMLIWRFIAARLMIKYQP